MTALISFEAYTGWVDITDPANIPADARTITAADLLRYENFGRDATAAINTIGDTLTALPDQYAPLSGLDAKAEQADLAAHTSNVANPHAVTKAQVGLGNADNTADTAKPVSTAQQAALDKLAKGCVYATAVTSDSGVIGTTQTVVGSIPSFAFKAGRNYRIVWDTNYFPGSTDIAAVLTIASAATTDPAAATTGLTVLGARNIQGRLYGISDSAFVTGYFKPAADITVQLKFLAHIDGSNAGTSLTFQGTSAPGGAPGWYRIYDDGAQI